MQISIIQILTKLPVLNINTAFYTAKLQYMKTNENHYTTLADLIKLNINSTGTNKSKGESPRDYASKVYFLSYFIFNIKIFYPLFS